MSCHENQKERMSLQQEKSDLTYGQTQIHVFRWNETVLLARRRVEQICGLRRKTSEGLHTLPATNPGSQSAESPDDLVAERLREKTSEDLSRLSVADPGSQSVESPDDLAAERLCEKTSEDLSRLSVADPGSQSIESPDDLAVEEAGAFREPEERQRQIAEAERVGRRFYSTSAIRTAVAFFAGGQVQGSWLRLGEASFHCQGFDFYRPDQILGGFVYLLSLTGEKTARLTGEGEMSLSETFYRDVWATALTEAGRELLQKHLAEKVGRGQMSRSFGPGYYGMEADQLPAFFQALSGERIGVSLSSGGALTPAKSCAGFYLWLTEAAPPMPDSCKSCRGNPGGCILCMKKAGALSFSGLR